MERFKKILVALDTRIDDHPIVEEAAEIAQRNDASLTLVDVLPEFTWAARLSLDDPDHVRQLLLNEKQEKLEAIKASLNASGVRVEAKVFQGTTSVEIIREVLRGGHDLVMRVAKGKHSRRAGFFGNTGFRLLRQCPCAVWLVTPSAPKFKHIMGCIDTSTGEAVDAELNSAIFEFASSVSLYHAGKLSLVHVWSIWNEAMLRSRMDAADFETVEKQNREQIEDRLDNFLQIHGRNLREENVHMLKGDPVRVIPDFAKHNGVDLVVMGTVGRSGMMGLVMGNTAEQILGQIECSVLALKPEGFHCPVSL